MPSQVVFSITGNDFLVVAGRVLTNFGDGDSAVMTFPNPLAAVKVGKNGNAIFAQNAMGRKADVSLRLIRGSPDDIFMADLLAAQQANFAAFVLLTGQFTKQIGDGQGDITPDNYLMNGGIFAKSVEVKSNVEGDTEQSLAIYALEFANAIRAI